MFTQRSRSAVELVTVITENACWTEGFPNLEKAIGKEGKKKRQTSQLQSSYLKVKGQINNRLQDK